MQALTRISLKFVEKCLPNAFLLAMVLSIVVFLLGMIFGGQSASTMFNGWGEGFSKLFTYRVCNSKDAFRIEYDRSTCVYS